MSSSSGDDDDDDDDDSEEEEEDVEEGKLPLVLNLLKLLLLKLLKLLKLLCILIIPLLLKKCRAKKRLAERAADILFIMKKENKRHFKGGKRSLFYTQNLSLQTPLTMN